MRRSGTTSIAKFFMEEGRDVLIVCTISRSMPRPTVSSRCLLRRPPGREAFPGDIFCIHARLLERATHLRPESGGGSMTALPIIVTEAQNLSAYIPTNLISITDGQIYLSPALFQKGVLPAVDVGLSVSRVGGKTPLAPYRAVAADLRLSYSQFEELEAFARFGTRPDEDTRRTLARGERVREVLKQPQYATLSAADQIVTLLAVTSGLFDLEQRASGGREAADRPLLVLGVRAAGRLEDARVRIAEVLTLPASAALVGDAVHEVLEWVDAWRAAGEVDGVDLYFNRPHRGAAFRPHRDVLLPLDVARLWALAAAPWRPRAAPTFAGNWAHRVAGARPAAIGRRTVNVAPCPTPGLAACTVPPCSSTS